MSPFHDLFSSAEFWSALILALLGGGGIGGLVGAWSNSRKTEADIDGITADAADKAVKILTESIIDPLREQVAFQETQIQHLETEPEFLKRHPKPSLPDELRPDVAPETIESNKEEQ